MKKQYLFTVILVTIFSIAAQKSVAQNVEHKSGLGVMIGEPTGFSFKTWLSETQAVDAGLAWSFGARDLIHLHADYLWHDFDFLNDNIDEGELPVYYGVGGRLVLLDDRGDPDTNAKLGVRFPLGISYLMEDTPIGFFFEVAPVVNIVPDTDFDADVIIGGRYYF